MPDMTDLATAKEQIKLGEEYRQRYSRYDSWKKYERWYRGDFDRNVMPENIFFPVGQAMIAKVAIRRPALTVTPPDLKQGLETHAQLREALGNYWLRETNVAAEQDPMVLDDFLYGIHVMLVGYDSQYGYVPDKMVMLEETGMPVPAMFDKKGYLHEYHTSVKPNMPWALRIHPRNVVFPYSASHFRDLPWFAFSYTRYLDDVKRDPRLNAKNLTPNVQIDGEGGYSGAVSASQRKESRVEVVKLWQVHDRRTGTVSILSQDHERFLLKPTEDVLQIEGLPITGGSSNVDPDDCIYGIAEGQILEPMQMEINEVVSQLRAYRQLAVRKILLAQGALKKEERAKLLSADLDAVVELQTKDLRSSAMVLNFNIPWTEYDAMRKSLHGTVRETVGFSRVEMGEYEQSSRRTATEVASVRQSHEIRIDNRRAAMARRLTEAADMAFDYMSRFWTSEMVSPIVGEDNVMWWIQYSLEEIKGDYNYTIDPDSSTPTTRDQRKQEAVQALQQLLPLAQAVAQAGMMTGTGEQLGVPYLVKKAAEQFPWLDPQKVIVRPGAGGSPGQPIGLPQYQAMQQQQRGVS